MGICESCWTAIKNKHFSLFAAAEPQDDKRDGRDPGDSAVRVRSPCVSSMHHIRCWFGLTHVLATVSLQAQDASSADDSNSDDGGDDEDEDDGDSDLDDAHSPVVAQVPHELGLPAARQSGDADGPSQASDVAVVVPPTVRQPQDGHLPNLGRAQTGTEASDLTDTLYSPTNALPTDREVRSFFLPSSTLRRDAFL